MARDFELDCRIEREVFGRVLPTWEEMNAEATRALAEQPRCLYFDALGGFDLWDRTVSPIEFRPRVPSYSSDLGTAWVLFEWLRDYDCVGIEAPYGPNGSAHFVWLGYGTNAGESGPTKWFNRRKPIGCGDDVCLALCDAALSFAALKREFPDGVNPDV